MFYGKNNFDDLYLQGLADFGQLTEAMRQATKQPKKKQAGKQAAKQAMAAAKAQVASPPPAAPTRGPAKTFKQSCEEKGMFWRNGMCFAEDPQAKAKADRAAKQLAAKIAHDAAVADRRAKQEQAKKEREDRLAAARADRDAKAAAHAAKVAEQKAAQAAKHAAAKADRQSKQDAAKAAHEAAVAAHKAKVEQAKADKAALQATRATCTAAGNVWRGGQCIVKQPGVVPDVTPIDQPALPPPGVPPIDWNRYQNCVAKQRRGRKIACKMPPGVTQPPGPPAYPPPPVYPPVEPPVVPTPVPLPPPSWYESPPPWWAQMPPGSGGVVMPPGGAPLGPLPPAGSGGQWDVPGGGGGMPGGPMLDESGLIPGSPTDQLIPGAEAAPAAMEVAGECSPGFSATLPQVYSDEWGEMTVLQVFCAQAPAQAQAQMPAQYQPGSGVDPFMPWEDSQGPSGQDSGAVGPMGTRQISDIESGEIGGAAPMGTGFGW